MKARKKFEEGHIEERMRRSTDFLGGSMGSSSCLGFGAPIQCLEACQSTLSKHICQAPLSIVSDTFFEVFGCSS